MSGRHTEQTSRPTGHGDTDRGHRNSSLQRKQHGQPTEPVGTTTPSSAMQRVPEALGHGFELPSLPQMTGLGASNFSPRSTPRLAGVNSILNPAQSEDTVAGRRRKVSELESMRGPVPSLPPLDRNTQSTLQNRISTSPVPAYGSPIDQPPRRILTPRSPMLHRTASLSRLQQPSGTISAQQVPFPGSPRSRTYAVAPGTSGAPPLPTPPAALRNAYGFTGPTPSSEAARRAGRDTRAPSGSASPTTSYSSYGQTEQTSPSSQYANVSMSAQSYGAGAANGSIGIPISSSGGQNTYQMMTLETTSGTVQLPVDVQAASRVADEKRRRNAGASARFRQRRKEKEKEASVTIGKLDQQVKELGEDADFYRRERDYLSGVLLQTPGGDRHFPRPPSPRRRRSSATQSGTSGAVGRQFAGAQEAGQRSPGHGRNVRRRTSTLSLPPPPLPQSAMAQHSTPFTPGYSMQQGGPILAPQPIPPQPPQRSVGALPSPSPLLRGRQPVPTTLPSVQPAPPMAPPTMQASPTTGPWNPYAASERRPAGAPGPREPRQG